MEGGSDHSTFKSRLQMATLLVEVGCPHGGDLVPRPSPWSD